MYSAWGRRSSFEEAPVSGNWFNVISNVVVFVSKRKCLVKICKNHADATTRIWSTQKEVDIAVWRVLQRIVFLFPFIFPHVFLWKRLLLIKFTCGWFRTGAPLETHQTVSDLSIYNYISTKSRYRRNLVNGGGWFKRTKVPMSLIFLMELGQSTFLWAPKYFKILFWTIATLHHSCCCIPCTFYSELKKYFSKFLFVFVVQYRIDRIFAALISK